MLERPSTREQVNLTFDKSIVDPVLGMWEGRVSGDIEGDLRTELQDRQVAGPIWHVSFFWIIEGDDPSRSLLTDREETIVDCLDWPDLSSGLAEVAKALDAGDGDLDWARLTRYLHRFGSGAVVKRLGFFVESLDLARPPQPELLNEWTQLPTAGISKLDPSTPREPHRIVTRWRVEVNLPEEGLGSPT